MGWRSGCTTARQVSAYSFPWDISPELMSKSVLPRVVLAAQISSISSPPAGILNFTGVQKFVSQHHQGATNKPNDDFCNSFPYTSGCIIHRDSTLFQRGQVPLPGPARAAKCPDYHQQHNITTHQNLTGCAAFLLCSPGKDT